MWVELWVGATTFGLPFPCKLLKGNGGVHGTQTRGLCRDRRTKVMANQAFTFHAGRE